MVDAAVVLELAAPLARTLGVEAVHVVAGALALVAFAATLALGVALVRWRTRATTACRWKRRPRPGESRLRRWECTRCGADAYTMTARSPRACQRASRQPGL